MQLLTTELRTRFQEIGMQETVKDPIVVAKFFNPVGVGTWYATEFYPEAEIFFGYVSLHEDEWGYFSLKELQEFKGIWGMGIERDLYCGEFPVSRILRKGMEQGCGCFG